MSRVATVLLLTIVAFVFPREASALITGGEGNKPVRDPGWPAGAAVIFNHAGRIAWWEGPPFGGGEWTAECRGDAKTLNSVLIDFARLDVKVKRIVVHDGARHSFWLTAREKAEKPAVTKMDWTFTVWQKASWEHLHTLPVDVNPTEVSDTSPSSTINVFTDGIDWARVTVPAGIVVVDNRLTAHGFQTSDGVVLEGKVTDLATGQPLAATMRLERVESQKKGGYLYSKVVEVKADAKGRWVLKNAPEGSMRVVVESAGFASRVAGYSRSDEQPCWQSYDIGLARPARVSGRVVDENGKAMADVELRFGNVQAASGGIYALPSEPHFKTDAEGRFRAEQMPVGTASIWAHKPDYYGPGLGQPVTMPAADVEVVLKRAGNVRVTVDFAGKKRPGGYLVKISPEGGDVVGSYGGSADLDDENRRTFAFLPPGRYVVLGRPNPGSDREETESVTVVVKGGETAEVTLKAK